LTSRGGRDPYLPSTDMKAQLAVSALLLSGVVWSQTPPPKITPSAEGSGTEAGKESKPGASWSESAKSGKQANDGTGGHAATNYAKQKAAEQKANQDGGPVVIPAAPTKP
jgi:hypothetical protein